MITPPSDPAQPGTNKYNLAQISFLIACGSALQLAETFLPSPIPGMHIGLANISTLLGLVLFDVPVALEVAIYRPLVTSLANGTFLSPGLVLNFWGSLASFACMAVAWQVTRRQRFLPLPALGIIGALAHAGMQVFMIYFWLIPHLGILALSPLVLVWAVIGGYLVGWSGKYVLDKLKETKRTAIPGFEEAVDRTAAPSVPLALKDKFKIIAAFGLAVSTVFCESHRAYLFLILIVLLLIVLYRQPVRPGRFISLWGAVIFSFILPVLFTPSGDLLWQWQFIKITSQGVSNGALFALRLMFLVCISVWIGVTEPSKLSEELAWILSPLKYFHFSVDRIPRLTSLSLSFIPVIWEKLSRVRPKKLTAILDVMVVFFAGLETGEGEISPAVPQKTVRGPELRHKDVEPVEFCGV